MSSAAVTILGIYANDFSLYADRLPKRGETVVGSRFISGPGGKGSNQAIAAAQALGQTDQTGRVNFITRIGGDSFGDAAIALWEGAHVVPFAVRDPEAPTGAAAILIDQTTGDNAILVVPGAADNLSPADIDIYADQIAASAVFVTQLEQPIETALYALKLAKSHGVTTVFNPAPAAELPDGMLALCDFVTPNESEAEQLTGCRVSNFESAEQAARKLQQRGVKKVIITLGHQGVLYLGAGDAVRIPAFQFGDVVDTSGAGDAFNGAFAASLAKGADDLAAAHFACAFASLSVTRPGTAQSMPTREETLAHIE